MKIRQIQSVIFGAVVFCQDNDLTKKNADKLIYSILEMANSRRKHDNVIRRELDRIWDVIDNGGDIFVAVDDDGKCFGMK